MMLRRFPVGAIKGRYRCAAAHFDGTNDYLYRGSAWTGAPDTSVGSTSFWFNKLGGDGTVRYILGFSGLTWAMTFAINSSNKLVLTGQDSGGGAAGFSITSTPSYLAGTGWHHVMAAWNNGSSVFDFYVDGAAIGYSRNYQSGNSDWTHPPQIGNSNDNSNTRWVGDLTEFWLNPTTYIDLSDATNRAKFIDGNVKPKFLGANGELPTGSTPLAYHRVLPGEAASAFASNQGSGGSMSTIGALTLASTSPSD